MLAQNSDVDGAVHSIRSLQTQFSQHFSYPWVFLNNEPWSEEFLVRVREAGSGADMVFETIPASMWGYPQWIDKDRARERMDDIQRDGGIPYARCAGSRLGKRPCVR
jgi:mannosyltransferase